MVPRSSYPPTVDHTSLTITLSPSAAQSHLATYLDKTSTCPHLHPDSLLSTTGIAYSAHSGPSGGLALHHLRRIEAGLRGENLVAETAEDLKHLTGDDVKLEGEGEGDDVKLDESIARTERKEGKKRKRVEAIRDWAEDAASSSHADAGGLEVIGREIESFAHTPLHQSDYYEQQERSNDPFNMENDDWQDQREYELQQRPLEGEVGEREEGAPRSRQVVGPPRIVKTGDGGGGGGSGKALSAEEKKARKGAKKAREMERRKRTRAG